MNHAKHQQVLDCASPLAPFHTLSPARIRKAPEDWRSPGRCRASRGRLVFSRVQVVRRGLAPILATFSLAFSAMAATSPLSQFDVFLGYDGIVAEASWFPVVCEMKNDGPPFSGIIELPQGNNDTGQARRMPVKLPTATLKRLVLPGFSTSRGYSSWDVRLFDDRGRVRAEQTGLRARKQIAADTPLVGALARTANGTPVLRPILPQSAELQPSSARFQPSIFPDNPLVLEGMSALYLNSEIASELKDSQVNAIYAWLNAGGHLIVAVEQVGDINSSPWLKSLFPCELTDLQKIQRHPEFQDWLQKGAWATNFNRLTRTSRGPPSPAYGGRPQRNRQESPPLANAESPFSELPEDFNFEAAELQVGTGTLRDGQVIVAAGEMPLIVNANRGRGRVTALLFSPEREPFRSWKNLPTFWAKLIEVPGAWYVSSDFNRQGGWSSDGIFGAMIDTRQVHKLPIEGLLLLLIVYFVVIGPLDQFSLEKIG